MLGRFRLPVAKVSTRDRQLVKLLASDSPSHKNLQKSVLDVAVTPCRKPLLAGRSSFGGCAWCCVLVCLCGLTVLALDLGNAGNVSSTEGMSATGKEEEKDHPHQEGGHLEGG